MEEDDGTGKGQGQRKKGYALNGSRPASPSSGEEDLYVKEHDIMSSSASFGAGSYTIAEQERDSEPGTPPCLYQNEEELAREEDIRIQQEVLDYKEQEDYAIHPSSSIDKESLYNAAGEFIGCDVILYYDIVDKEIELDKIRQKNLMSKKGTSVFYNLTHFKVSDPDPLEEEEDLEASVEAGANLRALFESRVQAQGCTIKRYHSLDKKRVFIFVTASYELLCKEAMKRHVKVPLNIDVIKVKKGKVQDKNAKDDKGDKGMEPRASVQNSSHAYVDKREESFFDQFLVEEPLRLIYAPFDEDKKWAFKNNEKGEQMFSRSIRSYMVHKMLHATNISDSDDIELNAMGFNYLVHLNIYNGSYSVHDTEEIRRELLTKWNLKAKFQPINSVRAYFGEKTAFYFSWKGFYTNAMIFASLVGLVVAIVGFRRALNVSSTASWDRQFQELVDNDVTPYYAFFLCIWATLFSEFWKRRSNRLAQSWGVLDYQHQEADRSEFVGVTKVVNPITGEEEFDFPFSKKIKRLIGSGVVVLTMILLVLASVTSVIVFRVAWTTEWWTSPKTVSEGIASALASVINAGSILVLESIYNRVAVSLTDWENHRTQTQYESSLILKTFAFQFVNSYSALYYTAFFRQQRTILGRWQDNCGEADGSSCLSLLATSLLALAIVRPLYKLLYREYYKKVKDLIFDDDEEDEDGHKRVRHEFEKESYKDKAPNFYIAEFSEQVIQFGYVTIFATALPFTPLIFMLFNSIDLRSSTKDLLIRAQRPFSLRAGGIGSWYIIIEFVSAVAVVTNAFMLATTSSWRFTVQDDWGLSSTWIIVLFEHIVFCIKFFIAWAIPDVPYDVDRSIRREQFQISRLLYSSTTKHPEQTKKLEEQISEKQKVFLKKIFMKERRKVTENLVLDAFTTFKRKKTSAVVPEDSESSTIHQRAVEPRPSADLRDGEVRVEVEAENSD
eukprot:Nk52_evm8s352 gene=Nk52_evmTU8s352